MLGSRTIWPSNVINIEFDHLAAKNKFFYQRFIYNQNYRRYVRIIAEDNLLDFKKVYNFFLQFTF